jgi:hypothetical protein
VPILEVAAAVTVCLAPYTPYLIEAGTKFAGGPGVSAWKKAEQIWSKLVFGGCASEVKATAKALSKDVNDADFGQIFAAAIARHLEARPKLAAELTSLLGGESAVQEIFAEDNAFVSGVKQRMQVAASKTKPPSKPVAIISYDEKPGIQAIATTAPDFPLEPSAHAIFAREHEYKRHGTISLLVGIDLVTGKVHALVKDRHRSREFIEFLKSPT